MNDPLGIFIIMHNLATLLIGGALGLSWHPRLAGLRGGAVPSMSSRWLDDFMEDEVLRDARWSAAGLPPGVSEDGALTYGEFSAERFHDLLGKAVALCGGDATNLTFIDIGSGAGRLVLCQQQLAFLFAAALAWRSSSPCMRWRCRCMMLNSWRDSSIANWPHAHSSASI